jgi:hypothetical protein
MPDDEFYEEQPFVQPPLKARKGRGAVSNLQGRYEVLAREAVDDGWSQAQPEHQAVCGTGPADYPGSAEERSQLRR